MELSIHPTLCTTKGPPQDQATATQSFSPSKKVMKIGGKDITFLLEGDHPIGSTQSGSGLGGNLVRGRRGIGRGGGWCGKVDLDKIGGENCVLPQEKMADCDWLGDSSAELCIMPIANEMRNREFDWLRESEKTDPNEMSDQETTLVAQQTVSLDTECVHRNAGEQERVLYILRGCPGSGKSTLSRELKGETGRVFSTDDFFIRSDGEYAFDPKKVAGFHKRNQERARDAISEGHSPVVIDNTNTTAWEMRPYVEMGLRHGYRVEFREPSTPWRYEAAQLSERNTHGVGIDTIRRMLKRFQKNVSVESVMGREAMKRIRGESAGEQLIEDEVNSNQDLLSNSADDCRSVGTSVSDSSVQDNESGAQEFESADQATNQVLRSVDFQLLQDRDAVYPPIFQNSASAGPMNDEDTKSADLLSNQIQASAVQDTETAVQDTETAVQDTETAFQDTETAVQDTETADQDKETAVQDTETADQDKETAVQDSETADQEDVLIIDPANQDLISHESADICQSAHDQTDTPNKPEIEHLEPRNSTQKSSIVSNQERFNQQLVSELTNRNSSIFCLNLQSLPVLQDILNIDKVLQVQSNFPLAQLLIPAQIRAQLTHTQIANFQHNYQRYIQHVLHGKRSNMTGSGLSDTSQTMRLDLRGSQGVYSQARMRATQPHVTLPLVPTPNISQSHKLSPAIHAETNLARTASPPISAQPSFPPNSVASLNGNQLNLEPEPSLPATNDGEKLEDSTFPFKHTSTPVCPEINSENQIEPIELSFKLGSESNEENGTIPDSVIDNSSLDTLSPDKSLSATSTLENSTDFHQATESKEGIQTNKETHSSTEALSIGYSAQTASHSIGVDSTLQIEILSNNQKRTDLNSSVCSTEANSPTEVDSDISRHNPDDKQMCETVFRESPPSVDASLPKTTNSPSEPEQIKRILSEKIDWSDSSESELSSPNLVTSGSTHSADRLPDNQMNANGSNTELKQAPFSKSAAPWNTWSGWSSNFITPHTHDHLVPTDQSADPQSGTKKFDPTIQPPKKHSTPAIKCPTDIHNFTPSFSRFMSFEDNSEIPLPQSTRKLSLPPNIPSAVSRPKWPSSESTIKGNPNVLFMPAGAEWQWAKATPNKSENSDTRSDSEDPRNSKPLNPFAIPWKPGETTNQQSTNEKLEHLKGFFPTLPLEELRAFLAQNKNDIDKTLEAIIDRAEEHNLDLPMSSQVPIPQKLAKRLRSPKKGDKVVTPLDATAPEFRTELSDTLETKWSPNGDATSNSWTNQSPFKESVASTFDTPEVVVDLDPQTKEYRKSSTENFVADTLEDTFSATTATSPDVIPSLNLSSDLIGYLVKKFGPIPGYTKESSLEQSQIPLSEDSARNIHQIWCRSHAIQSPPFFPPSPQSGGAWVPPEDPIEQAKLRIYTLYPGIDTATLDQILAAKNFSLSAANNFIQAALNSAKMPQQNLVPSFAHITKQSGTQSFPPLPSKSHHQRQTNSLFGLNTSKPSF